jgi:hypothetical protein
VKWRSRHHPTIGALWAGTDEMNLNPIFDGERDWCAGRSVTEQRRLAIIFRSGGVVVACLNLRTAISAVPDRSRLSPHLFEEGGCEVLALPREALLVRLEVRNAPSNLVTL